MNIKKTVLRFIPSIIGLGAFAFTGFLLLSWFMNRQELPPGTPQETRSLRKYPALLAVWNQSEYSQELVAHFPKEIPKSARLKKFYHYPGFLQGGADIQLRLALPSDEIDRLYIRFLQRRTKSFFGGDSQRHMNQTNGMPTTSFLTGKKNRYQFPEDYEIMIFDKLLPRSGGWNHGRSHGVAISTNRREIVYWAASW